MPPITLLSDFGSQDASVAIAKGIIMQHVPGAQVVDISHHVETFNIQQAAYLLLSAYPNFPKGTCHILLFDVFSEEKPRLLLCEHQGQYLLAPDNGVLSLAFGASLQDVWVGSSSCKKDRLLDSGGQVRFSTDTLAFDTVFTALGSATQIVKIFNTQNQKVVLSSVRLEGGTASFFNLNVDGRQGKSASNIEIAANDSVYVFASVKVDPTNANTPFIIEDKLIATLNGTDFSIPVIAYGQNAHYIQGRYDFEADSTLLTDKPYVVFGAAVVDSGVTLRIPAGCRIYMHANARLFVYGTLLATGTQKDSIIFQGDRLDRAYFGYEGYPGEWGGIYFFASSVNNVLTHVLLRNGGNGAQGAPPALIQLEPDLVPDTKPQLTLDKVILENSIGYGLLSFGGSLLAENCLIHSCGATALALLEGGNYQLDHCTIATYGNNKIAHNDNPAAVVLNYFTNAANETTLGVLNATLRNCFVSGSLSEEFIADTIVDSRLPPSSLTLSKCILKTTAEKIEPKAPQNSIQYLSSGPAYDSLFKSISKSDYHPASTSPLINAAVPIGITEDLDYATRDAVTPDVGCYEYK